MPKKPWTSDQIVELREKRGETQQEFAQAVGVTVTSISHWECGVSLPNTRIILDRLQELRVEANDPKKKKTAV